MRVLVAVAAAALAVGAVALLAASFQPSRRRPLAARRQLAVSPATIAAAMASAVAVLLVTRWVLAAAAAAVLVLVWSSLFQSQAATRERRRVAAIAKWLEDLRDLQRGSNLDLPQALDRSAVRAPTEIEPELTRFVDRVRHHSPLDEALVALAAELDHPTSDMAIAAMLFAYGHASGSVLFDTFEELAASARDELTARDQIDRLRARFESSMRRMLVILAALVGYLLVASGDTLEEYNTPTGQAFLVVPIGIWSLALWWLRRLSRYQRGGRYLDYTAVAAARSEGAL
jgi:Flp pilus assembly protein TadB